jgi:exo-beta-1,3-glucanase (GH17 family)
MNIDIDEILIIIIAFIIGFVVSGVLRSNLIEGVTQCSPGITQCNPEARPLQKCPDLSPCPESGCCDGGTPPSPIPNMCEGQLNASCGDVRTDEAKCNACITTNQSVLMKAECSPYDVGEYCEDIPGPPPPGPPPPSGMDSDYIGICVDDSSINSESYKMKIKDYNLFRLYQWHRSKVQTAANFLLSRGKKIMITINVKSREGRPTTLNNIKRDIDNINDLMDKNNSSNVISVSIGNEWEPTLVDLVINGLIYAQKLKQFNTNIKLTSCLMFDINTVQTPYNTHIDWENIQIGNSLRKILKYIDVISVNVYTMDGSQRTNNGSSITGISFNDKESFFYNIIAQLRKAIGNNKELWITETGWPWKFIGDDPDNIRNSTNQMIYINGIKNLNKNSMVHSSNFPSFNAKLPDKIFLFAIDCNQSNTINEYFGIGCH